MERTHPESKIPTNHSRYLKTCKDQKIYVAESESVYLANTLDQQIDETQAHPLLIPIRFPVSSTLKLSTLPRNYI